MATLVTSIAAATNSDNNNTDAVDKTPASIWAIAGSISPTCSVAITSITTAYPQAAGSPL